MWSIHDVGVVAVQLVRMDGCASVSVRLGLSHPILFAQCCRAGWAPPLSVLVQLELRSPMRNVWCPGLRWCLHFSHDEILDVG